jgi:hypothetical protein
MSQMMSAMYSIAGFTISNASAQPLKQALQPQPFVQQSQHTSESRFSALEVASFSILPPPMRFMMWIRYDTTKKL